MLDTYAALVASVTDWLDDTSLTALVPDFIVLAEADLNRRLRIDTQEARATTPLLGEYTTLPDDFGGMRSIHMEGSPDRPLVQMAASEMMRSYAGLQAGCARAFAIVAGQLQVAPVPTGGAVEMIYYRALPALTVSAPTNWLLAAHPDAYLIATLLQAEFHGWNDKRLPLLKGRLDEIVDQIGTASRRKQWGAAPIAPRTAPYQTRGARI